MKFKLLFIFTLIFSSLPLAAITQELLNEQLAHAVEAGNIEQVESYLLQGAEPDTRIADLKFESPTALIFTAELGKVHIVKLFLDHHANINAQDDLEETALMKVARKGYIDIAKLLLEHKADVNIPSHEGNSALMIAAKNGNVEITKLLLNHHADVNVIDNQGKTLLRFFYEKYIIYYHTFPQYQYFLSIDDKNKQEKDVEIIKLLIEKGADINTINKHLALSWAIQNNYTEIAKLLIENYTEIAEMLIEKSIDYKRDSLIFSAVNLRNIKSVKLLLDHGVNPNVMDRDHQTPLTCAIRNGYTKISKLLLNYGAKGTDLRKPYIDAIRFHDQIILKILLKKGFDIKKRINLRGFFGAGKETALEYAASSHWLPQIELLIKHINHILDKTDDPEICQKWDQYILDALNEGEKEWNGFDIKTINAFRLILHHANKLPLSRKKFESVTAKTLGAKYGSEYAFIKTLKHLRTHAF